MSTSNFGAGATLRRSWGSRLFGSELGLVLRRRRNIVMVVGLAAVPVVVAIVLRVVNPPAGADDGPPSFITQVTSNGLFLGFAALVIVTPFLMPLTMSVVSGDSIAGEASQGTLRYLLTAPVARGRVLAVKYVAGVVYGLVASVVVAAVGLAVGALLFPVRRITLLSGVTIPLPETLGRALLMALYATVLMAGFIAIGLFVSTLTEVPIAAMAATAALPVVAQILGAIPQLSGLHPWLFTDTWVAYGDFLRDPITWDTITRGVLTQAGYAAVFLSLAWARLTSRDITS
ncbi:MAG TPA: ABC transporter permease [Jiangellaceae bacterium]|nr:ABC transporter permease [Jiangellaceae bacterium]